MDVFDALDVSLREDTYSSLLVHVFEKYPTILNGVFEELTGQPLTGQCSVRFRGQIGDDRKNRPDIIVEAPTRSGVWMLVIEAKVQSGEGHEQTRRYLKLCEDARKDKKCVGHTLCFLTLGGDQAEMDLGCKEVTCWQSLTHLQLAQIVGKLDTKKQLKSDPVLATLWHAYTERLEHYEQLEAPKDDQRILEWLKLPSKYFITKWERASVLGKSLFPQELQREGGVYPGKGTNQFYAHACEPGWNSDYFRDRKVQRLIDCLSIQYELSFPLIYAEGGVKFRLNFYSNPYMPEREIESLGKAKSGFRRVRDFMRKQLHERLKKTEWKAANHKLQMANLACALDESTTVGEMKAYLAPHIQGSRGKVNEALKKTAREFHLSWGKAH